MLRYNLSLDIFLNIKLEGPKIMQMLISGEKEINTQDSKGI